MSESRTTLSPIDPGYRSCIVSSLDQHPEAGVFTQFLENLSDQLKVMVEGVYEEMDETFSELSQSWKCRNPPMTESDDEVKEEGCIPSVEEEKVRKHVSVRTITETCFSTTTVSPMNEDELKQYQCKIEKNINFDFVDDFACQISRTESTEMSNFENQVFENRTLNKDKIKYNKNENAKFVFEMESTCFDADHSTTKNPALTIKLDNHEDSEVSQKKCRQSKEKLGEINNLNLFSSKPAEPSLVDFRDGSLLEHETSLSHLRLIRTLSRTPLQKSQLENKSGSPKNSENLEQDLQSGQEWLNPLYEQYNPKFNNSIITKLKRVPNFHSQYALDESKPTPKSNRSSEASIKPPRLSPALSNSLTDSSYENIPSYDNYIHTDSGYISSSNAAQDKVFRYVKYKEIGEGCFGRVYLAQDTQHKEKVVLKELDQNMIRVDQVAEEVSILNRFPHDKIMKLLDHFSTVTHYCMVYEFQSQVSLFEYLKLTGKQKESTCQVILRQVVDAMEWLHENMVVHGDIKDENMIIEPQTRNVMLIDFGSAKLLDDAYEPITFKGTKVYCPPEAIVGDIVFGHSVDVWTIGTLVYVVLNNKRPFIDEQEILNACLPYPRDWSDGAKDFVRQCLNRQYLDRPTTKLLKYHPWLCANE